MLFFSIWERFPRTRPSFFELSLHVTDFLTLVHDSLLSPPGKFLFLPTGSSEGVSSTMFFLNNSSLPQVALCTSPSHFLFLDQNASHSNSTFLLLGSSFSSSWFDPSFRKYRFFLPPPRLSIGGVPSPYGAVLLGFLFLRRFSLHPVHKAGLPFS